ncbi:MAG: IS200/IS605 family transposase [Phycisphaeraceae bacterium]|nr:IS200/IS605 family transposase [Phycisphaeraceae bacterium]
MPRAWTQNYYHLIYSTRHRKPWITPDLESRLYPFVIGIARDLGCQMIALNGMPDHIHMVLRYPSQLSHADMVRHLKGRSSRWIHEEFSTLADFSWQEGYGGFTVSRSSLDAAAEYVRRQKEHHARMSFEDEFMAFLERHGLQVPREEALG